MTRFIPREKLGKKARKALDGEKRAVWAVPPITRRMESAKRYDRKKQSHACKDAWTWDCFLRSTEIWGIKQNDEASLSALLAEKAFGSLAPLGMTRR